jgi:hypothetical protein
MTQLMEPARTDLPAPADLAGLPAVPDEEHDRPSRHAQPSSGPWLLSPNRYPPEQRVRLRRRILPVLAVAVIVMAYVYATKPFTFAGVVECRPNGVAGASPAPGTPAGTIVGDAARRCAEAGGSRQTSAGMTALLAAVVGVAGAVAPSRTEVEARRGQPSERERPGGPGPDAGDRSPSELSSGVAV